MGRKRGRPALDATATDPSVRINLTVPVRMYDALWKRAYVADLSVPEVIRRAVGRQGHYDAAVTKLPK
jgi:hypothetical protein